MNTAENTQSVTSTAVVETPKSVTTPAQIKSPINFGAQGVKLASLEDAFRFANAIVAKVRNRPFLGSTLSCSRGH